MLVQMSSDEEKQFETIKGANPWITVNTLAQFRGLTVARRQRLLDNEELSDEHCGELGSLLQPAGAASSQLDVLQKLNTLEQQLKEVKLEGDTRAAELKETIVVQVATIKAEVEGIKESVVTQGEEFKSDVQDALQQGFSDVKDDLEDVHNQVIAGSNRVIEYLSKPVDVKMVLRHLILAPLGGVIAGLITLIADAFGAVAAQGQTLVAGLGATGGIALLVAIELTLRKIVSSFKKRGAGSVEAAANQIVEQTALVGHTITKKLDQEHGGYGQL